ncbi:SusC/RagA family TonB-linked outer membrane protein [Sphingobacterium lactis]|uniref:SusC/RagA family TonB-linked outer membrane protein n=1 Tax=Sphingobacterium lactis TaxID=797291 RepID=UPI003F80ABA9
MELNILLKLTKGKMDIHTPKQWIKILNYCVLLLLIALANNTYGSALQIHMDKKNAKIEDVLIELRRQSNIDFFYNKADLLKEGPKDLKLNNESLDNAMRKLLENTNLTYSIKDGIVTLSPKAIQQQKITGRITNQKGEPLQNISITAINRATKSKTVGGQSSANGTFTIIVSTLNDTLTFSSIGYEERVIPLNGKTHIEVVMKQKVQELEDVVITGIYERKAESFTGSSMTIKNEDIKRMGSTNVFQSLKNISPSMFLDNLAMGSNPNTLPDLQIRGSGSLPVDNGNLAAGLKGNYLKDPTQPLFILDGFEASVERIFDLDINRIESVTILKDAASKAIYGSKAANGVIVIETTKISGSKPIISYNMSLNVELPDLTSYNLTNSREKLEAEVIDGMYLPRPGYDPSADYIQRLKTYNARKKLVEEGLDTYWLAKPVQNGVGHRHSLSAELGSEDLRVLTDFTYNQVTGAMIGSGRQNIGGNISASYRLNKFLFRNVASFNSNKGKESPYGEFSEYVQMNPYWRATNEDGSIPYYAELSGNSRVTNPLYNSTLNSKIAESYLNFTNNLYMEWMPIDGLRGTMRIGIDTKTSDADEFYPGKHTRFDLYQPNDINRRGSYQVNNGKSAYLSGDLNVNYSKQLDKHYLFGNIGYNVSERKFSERVYFAEGFPSDRLQDIIFARSYALDTRPAGLDGITRDMGFLGAFSYMWDNRFISDFTYRANASSQFGADRRWASFWSVGLGWNLHNEQFFKKLNYVDMFRIRGSVGATGNQNFNSNASIATYEYALQAYYNGFPGSQLFNMVNPGLQWESSFDYNGGVDLKIGPFGLRADYYQRFTENLIADITLPSSTGFEIFKDNLGKIKNEGLELYANYQVWQKQRNFVSLQFGIETNTNKIVELSNSMKSYNDRMDALAADRGNSKPIKKFQDGMPMDAIWAVPSLGIDPASGNEIYVKQDGTTTYAWNANDMIMAGIARPKYQGTFGVQAEYQGIGLSVTARYLGGGQMYNQTLVDRVENVDMVYNVDKRVLTGRWLEPGQNALYKRLGEYSIDNGDGTSSPAQELTRATTRFVQDRKELDIAAINLYYDFYKQSWLKKAKLQRLRASFNMNDAVKFSSIEIERGLTYPFSRTVSFSLNATF